MTTKWFNACILGFCIGGTHPADAAGTKFWTEKDPAVAPLVNLPNFEPIVDSLDVAVVNVAGTTEPKQQEQKRRGHQQQPGSPQQGPNEPYMNPDEFFEKFFGMPFREAPPQQRKTLGSGFIISKDGYILTNNHVVEGSDKIEITILSAEKEKIRKKGNTFQAKIVGRDPATDVAVLKIDTGFDLPFAPLGDSTKMKKGDWVLAFGNPFGLDHSVSAGIISALGREINSGDNRRFDDFLQTDAAINFGNSGGPLVNLRGEVIGINTAITAQGSGIGFAVPINLVKDVIIPLKESGAVSRGYLGVMIQDVSDEIKDALGLSVSKGVLVNDVVEDGPASGKLKRGDVIVKVNKEDAPDAHTLQRLVAKVRPGNNVDLEVIRDKKIIQVSVKLGNLGENKEPKEKGAATDEKADKLGLIVDMAGDGKTTALQVQDVDPSSAAAQAGIAPGDIIHKINGDDVKSVEKYQKLVKGLKSKSTVLFDLERGNVKLFIAFKIP